MTKILNNYTNLITIFSLILLVEYADEGYDKWDFIIGVFGFVIGLKFFKDAFSKKDWIYSFITSSLLILSSITIILSIISFGPRIEEFLKNLSFLQEYKFWVFAFCSLILFIIIQFTGKTRNNNGSSPIGGSVSKK